METLVATRALSQISILTKTWLSETAFISDEIKFLKKLVNHQTIFLSNENYLSMLIEMRKELTAIEKEVHEVKENIKRQCHLIYDVLADKKTQTTTVQNNHVALEEQVASLTRRFRSMKTTVLKNAAKILELRQDIEID